MSRETARVSQYRSNKRYRIEHTTLVVVRYENLSLIFVI